MNTRVSGVVKGGSTELGNSFSARQFRYHQFAGLMNPLIMVDDYTMTAPTFGIHAHAGIAAVSLLFEDSAGDFANHDSLDNHLVLRAGDLYWLHAGRGALHDEAPIHDPARIRGLQMFIKLSRQESALNASSFLVRKESMPVIEADGVRVKVVMSPDNVCGETASSRSTTILDGYLEASASYFHTLPGARSAWVFIERGEATIAVGGVTRTVAAGESLAAVVSNDGVITITASQYCHFVLVSSQPVNEPFVQDGPFALATQEEIDQVKAQLARGELGEVTYKPFSDGLPTMAPASGSIEVGCCCSAQPESLT